MEALAQQLGSQLLGGDVLLMTGEMGSGKTTFTRALARGMGVTRPDRVCSPTYTVCMDHAGDPPLVHLDLFRLGEQGDGKISLAGFESLGLEHDELPGPDKVLVVEWAELWDEPPAEHLRLEFARGPAVAPAERQLRAVGVGRRGEILARAWGALATGKT
jgi:tRNA threonylcarbamoyl adenosine modification protein YjeE